VALQLAAYARVRLSSYPGTQCLGTRRRHCRVTCNVLGALPAASFYFVALVAFLAALGAPLIETRAAGPGRLWCMLQAPAARLGPWPPHPAPSWRALRSKNALARASQLPLFYLFFIQVVI
jgi:hypothetical protein